MRNDTISAKAADILLISLGRWSPILLLLPMAQVLVAGLRGSSDLGLPVLSHHLGWRGSVVIGRIHIEDWTKTGSLGILKLLSRLALSGHVQLADVSQLLEPELVLLSGHSVCVLAQGEILALALFHHLLGVIYEIILRSSLGRRIPSESGIDIFRLLNLLKDFCSEADEGYRVSSLRPSHKAAEWPSNVDIIFLQLSLKLIRGNITLLVFSNMF
jgi:hypothetical protein